MNPVNLASDLKLKEWMVRLLRVKEYPPIAVTRSRSFIIPVDGSHQEYCARKDLLAIMVELEF